MRLNHVLGAAISIAALPILGSAQVTEHTVLLGGGSAVGCQNSTVPPTLDDGVTVGTAQLDFRYDASTAILELSVTNTSPDVPGTPNPVITQVAFNLPVGTVQSIELLSQTPAGGAQTTFAMTTDLDLTTLDSATRLGCLGYFNVSLMDNKPAIANANATTISAPGGTYAIGTVKFTFQLGGSGVGLLTAATIGSANSAPGGEGSGYNAGVKFQAGGANAEFSGYISAGQPDCIPAMWTSAPARIGTTIDLCAGATASCHGCLLISATPGPSIVVGYTLPIGLPVLLAIPLPQFNPQPQCYPISIPDDVALVGLTLYMTLATTSVGIQFSPAFELSIVN
jgi:hypothetical protein